MRPERLRPEVQFGPALTLWQHMNGEPTRVTFERQSPRTQESTPFRFGLFLPSIFKLTRHVSWYYACCSDPPGGT
jgi:hypothetical protein